MWCNTTGPHQTLMWNVTTLHCYRPPTLHRVMQFCEIYFAAQFIQGMFYVTFFVRFAYFSFLHDISNMTNICANKKKCFFILWEIFLQIKSKLMTNYDAYLWEFWKIFVHIKESSWVELWVGRSAGFLLPGKVTPHPEQPTQNIWICLETARWICLELVFLYSLKEIWLSHFYLHTCILPPAMERHPT